MVAGGDELREVAGEPGEGADVWRSLGHQLPSLAGYAVSFLTILIIVVVVLALLVGAVLLIQARRRRGGVIVDPGRPAGRGRRGNKT